MVIGHQLCARACLWGMSLIHVIQQLCMIDSNIISSCIPPNPHFFFFFFAVKEIQAPRLVCPQLHFEL